MSRHTIVVDFADSDEPSYSAGTVFLGGKVVAVAFADELERIERLEENADLLSDVLDEAMSMLGSRLIKDTFGYEWHEKALAAIAKAKGETA